MPIASENEIYMMSRIEHVAAYVARHGLEDSIVSFNRMIYLATILSMIVATLFGWNFYDVLWWLNWIDVVRKNGVLALYHAVKNAYLPLASLLFVSTYILASNIVHNLELAIVFTKVFLCLIPAILTYIILRKTFNETIAILWLLATPVYVVIYGMQFDLVIAMLLTISIIAAARKRYVLSGVTLGLATCIKPVVIVAAAPIALSRGVSIREKFKFILVLLMVIATICLPFALYDINSFLAKAILFHARRYPQHLSLWAIPVHILREGVCLAPYLTWLWIPFVLVALMLALYVIYVLSKEHTDYEVYLYASTLLLLMIVIVLNKIGNVNYLLWCYPAALALAAKCRRASAKAIVFLLNTATIIDIALYEMFYRCIDVVSGKPILIVEDMAYWSARDLMILGTPSWSKSMIMSLTTSSKWITHFAMLQVLGEIMSIALYNAVLMLALAIVINILVHH